jgi:hypothetical protein
MSGVGGLRRAVADRFVAMAVAAVVAFCSLNAADADPRDAVERIAFDIPTQSLETALHAYAAASGRQVLYAVAVASGRHSSAVKGIFTPGAALGVLLTGTGLVGRPTDVDAFTISPSIMEPAAAAPAAIPDARYLGAVQAGILGAICRNTQTWPGEYKIAVQLWIAPSGAVEGTALLGSTGESGRDAILLNGLRDIVIDARPPAGMPQPITMAVVPRSPRETGDCLRR